jgi:hypothetical protein
MWCCWIYSVEVWELSPPSRPTLRGLRKAGAGNVRIRILRSRHTHSSPAKAATFPAGLGGSWLRLIGSDIPIEISSVSPEKKRERLSQSLAKARGTEN